MNWLTLAYAGYGILLAPFGDVSTLVQSDNPWKGFHADDPILWVVRVQQFQSKECKKWIDAVRTFEDGSEWKLTEPSLKVAHLKSGWGTWDSDELDAVKDCSELPCAVKLNQPESAKLTKYSSDERFERYLEIVTQRSEAYLKTKEKLGYEFKEKPIEPWSLFQKHGISGKIPSDIKPRFLIRKLDFKSNQMKVLRQVLDRRVEVNPEGTEVNVWVKDVYTDHYFDSWGEFTKLVCHTPKKDEITLIQVMVFEFDMLKNTDLISKMMRGKMKGAVEKLGQGYLEKSYNRFKPAS